MGRGVNGTAEKARADKVHDRSPRHHVANQSTCVEDLRNLAMIESEHGKPGATYRAVNSEWKTATWTIHAVFVRHEHDDSRERDTAEQTDEASFHEGASDFNKSTISSKLQTW